MASLVSLPALAKEITMLHDICQQDSRSAIERAIQVGEKLAEAKSQVSHGEWIPWVEKNLPFGRIQAAKYMRVYENRDKLPNETSSIHLAEAVSLLSEPRPKPKQEPIKIEAELLPLEDDEPQYDGNTGQVQCGDEDADDSDVEYRQEKDHQEIDILKEAEIFKEWDNTLKVLNSHVLYSISNCRSAARIFKPFFKQAIKRLREVLANARPEKICDSCDGCGCVECENTGYLTVSQVKGIGQ